MIRKILLLMFCSCVHTASIASENLTDVIHSFSAPEIIGVKDVPRVNLVIDVTKPRELHVTLQEFGTWRTVKSMTMRVNESGNYHFDFEVEELTSGRYRWNAYLSPRGKKWQDRLTEPHRDSMQVIAKDHYTPPKNLAKHDRVKSVNWPKTIVDDKEHILTVKYDVTTARDLEIRLLDSTDWQEFGNVKVTVEESGQIQLPFNSMLSNFPAGKYAWVVDLKEQDSDNSILAKRLGYHFEIASGNLKVAGEANLNN
ncbi:hypothetical protein [Thalassotalea mangrovi]|uniref:DUF4198 domain-containing protein n=1 Tax=Thalassotalea mangrovi TaxID=2572245 RepID=A0A4U1B2F5_9GAMM|nr:hypothetical protein [Thalassotalea mangrovi]TKB43583.1 hypothetical protein E8M12_14510 [Thalassotalea mangrovi]